MATELVTVDPPVIRVAGGIILRATQRGDEVMIVFRKRHQDWTLPKGEVKEGESFQEAALREVEEETGCSCQLGNYLGTISYADNGVPKVMMFWKMTVVQETGVVADSEEIGEAVWMQVPAAIQRLSHNQEKSLLSRAGSSGVVSASSVPRTASPQVETVSPAAPRPRLPFLTPPKYDSSTSTSPVSCLSSLSLSKAMRSLRRV